MEESDFTMDMTAGSDEDEPTKAKVQEVHGGNVLDRLRSIVEQEVRRPDIEIEIPDRPGVSVVFSPNIEQSDLIGWRKKSGEGSKAGINFLRFAAEVVGACTVQIKIEDEPALDENGNPLTFGDAVILDMVDEDRPWPGIKKFWGNDAHLQATSLAILEAAGWGDEAEVENPTRG